MRKTTLGAVTALIAVVTLTADANANSHLCTQVYAAGYGSNVGTAKEQAKVKAAGKLEKWAAKRRYRIVSGGHGEYCQPDRREGYKCEYHARACRV